MRSRDDILTLLLEPYSTLSDEIRAEAHAWAAQDSDVARALRECRAMGALTAQAVYGESPMSDAAFLVQVRQRIETAQKPYIVKSLFGSARLITLTATACVAIMVFVLGNGRWWGTSSPTESLTESAFVSALETPGVVEYDSLLAEEVSPESLAVYLGMPEMVEDWNFDVAAELPLSDELLALDEQSLDEVMSDLQATEFF
ncbi:MAG: hypothetical protein ACOZB3_08410 [Calditrichota bacterium]